MTDEMHTDEPTPLQPERPSGSPRPLADSAARAPAAPAPPGERRQLVEAYTAHEHRHRTRMLSGEDLAMPGRRVKLPLILFIATCFTTFWAGCTEWFPGIGLSDLDEMQKLVAENWRTGLVYMLAVMGILLAHEMGHFVQTVRYHIPASWPFFIPIVGVPTGTMGAVIGLDGSRANRREMFDMGISGPLAGLVLAVPIGFYAIANMTPVAVPRGAIIYHDPLLFRLMIDWIHPAMAAGQELTGPPLISAMYMAAWVGMLVTGLNMLPIGQLDGGHVAYCMFGKSAHTLARSLLLFAIAYMLISNNDSWIIMIVLVIVIGTDHPPTHDDTAHMGPLRYAIVITSLAIPILCFMPTPISVNM
jgi:membrane-associated protease RseP (regulator of RpoE activity)